MRISRQPGFSLRPSALIRLRLALTLLGLLAYALIMAAGGLSMPWASAATWTVLSLLLVRFAAAWRWGPLLALLGLPIAFALVYIAVLDLNKTLGFLVDVKRTQSALLGLTRALDPWMPLLLAFLIPLSLRAPSVGRREGPWPALRTSLPLHVPPLSRALLRCQPGWRLLPRMAASIVVLGAAFWFLHGLPLDLPEEQASLGSVLIFLALLFALQPWVTTRRQQAQARAAWGLTRLLPGLPVAHRLVPPWRTRQWRTTLGGHGFLAALLIALLLPFGSLAAARGALALALSVLVAAVLTARSHPEDRPHVWEAAVPFGAALLILELLGALKPGPSLSLALSAIALAAAFLLFNTLHRRRLTP